MSFLFKVLILCICALYVTGLEYADELLELQSQRQLFRDFSNQHNNDYTYKITTRGATGNQCDHKTMVVTVTGGVVSKVEFDDCQKAAVCKEQPWITAPANGYTIMDLFQEAEDSMNMVDIDDPTIIVPFYSESFHYIKDLKIKPNNDTDQAAGWNVTCISIGPHQQCVTDCKKNVVAAKNGLRGKGELGLNMLYNEDEPWEWNEKIHYIVGILFFVGLCAIGILIMFCVIMRSHKKKAKKPQNKREKYWFDTDKASDVQHKYETKNINKKRKKKINDLSDSELDSDADQPVPLMVEV